MTTVSVLGWARRKQHPQPLTSCLMLLLLHLRLLFVTLLQHKVMNHVNGAFMTNKDQCGLYTATRAYHVVTLYIIHGELCGLCVHACEVCYHKSCVARPLPPLHVFLAKSSVGEEGSGSSPMQHLFCPHSNLGTTLTLIHPQVEVSVLGDRGEARVIERRGSDQERENV